MWEVVANVLSSNMVVSEFEYQSRYYFWTNTLEESMNPLIPSTLG